MRIFLMFCIVLVATSGRADEPFQQTLAMGDKYCYARGGSQVAVDTCRGYQTASVTRVLVFGSGLKGDVRSSFLKMYSICAQLTLADHPPNPDMVAIEACLDKALADGGRPSIAEYLGTK